MLWPIWGSPLPPVNPVTPLVCVQPRDVRQVRASSGLLGREAAGPCEGLCFWGNTDRPASLENLEILKPRRDVWGWRSDHITPFQTALFSTLKKCNAAIPKTRDVLPVSWASRHVPPTASALSAARLPQSRHPCGWWASEGPQLGSLHPASCPNAPGDTPGDFQGRLSGVGAASSRGYLGLRRGCLPRTPGTGPILPRPPSPSGLGVQVPQALLTAAARLGCCPLCGPQPSPLPTLFRVMVASCRVVRPIVCLLQGPVPGPWACVRLPFPGFSRGRQFSSPRPARPRGSRRPSDGGSARRARVSGRTQAPECSGRFSLSAVCLAASTRPRGPGPALTSPQHRVELGLLPLRCGFLAEGAVVSSLERGVPSSLPPQLPLAALRLLPRGTCLPLTPVGPPPDLQPSPPQS